MNNIKIGLIALLASLPALALADEGGNFRYTGNNTGKQICKAVVNDDVPKLRLALRTYKHSLTHSYTFDLSGRELSRDFTCNGMDVEEFSRQIGALKVAGFLIGTGQTHDGQVAVSAR